MTFDAWLTLTLVLATGGLLAATRIAPDLILVGALTVLMVSGVLSPADALAGFSNPGLATVAVLYVVVAGLVDTGAIHMVGARMLGRPRSVRSAQARLMLPVTGLSAFLNNTPVVAMLVPVVEDWCRRHELSVSKLMMPLSYAAILGGTCTLIGTSTNLVVNGLVLEHTDLPPMGFFDIAAIGLPTAIVGVLFVLVASPRLLIERRPPLRTPEDAREYAIEMLVDAASPLVGKTIEQAGLRNLPGGFLAEIQRGDQLFPAVAPSERLNANDRLLFVGVVESIVDLVKLRGLVPAPDQLFNLGSPRPERRLIEAVVSASAPIAGRTIRASEFRSRYDAVVIAVARNGERLRGKVGDIQLRPGDTLLIEAKPSFVERQKNSRDFLLVSELAGSAPPRHDRAFVAIAILGAMVLAAATGFLSMLEAAMLAGGAMIASRCTTGPSARATVDWSVLIVIASALGLGLALETTGAAGAVAHGWISLSGGHPWSALAAVYVITSVLTAFITNNAAAVLLFPIAQATAAELGVSLWPFVVVIMMGASASFATPIGYQTNLMVYGPGGYRFSDYLRIGIPLNLLLGAVTVILTPIFWPF